MILYLPFKNEENSSKKTYLILVFSILGIMMMFKAENVGNDTYEYIQLFYLFNIETFLEMSTRYEIGYVLLNKLLGYIYFNPQIIFIFTGAFVAFAFGRFIFKYSDLPWLSVIMFLTLQFFDISMSGIRQILAVSILTFAYDQLISRKILKFTIIVFLATTIHVSSFLFFLLYFLKEKKFNVNFFLILLMITIIAYSFFDIIILAIIEQIFPIYIKYFTQSSLSFSNEPKLATILNILYWGIMFIVAIIIYNKKFYKISAASENNIVLSEKEINFNMQSIMLLLSIIMLVLALYGTILTRFKYIFSFVLLAYYPNALFSVKNGILRAQLIIISIAVFTTSITVIYLLRPEWQSTFPYRFFWQ